MTLRKRLDIAVLIFPGLTVLNAVGPYEVLSRLPGSSTTIVAPRAGLIPSGNEVLALQAGVSIADVSACDVLVVSGGTKGVRPMLNDHAVLDWLRIMHASSTWTASVCTGSLLLAAAGLLDGQPATTHWAAMDELERLGAIPVAKRVVEAGKVVTSAGVSAGIDMALLLASRIAGDEVAQAIQLAIEYDPQPPFRAGSPQQAPPHIVQMVEAHLNRQSD